MSRASIEGVLVVGHGSRRAEANDDLRLVAQRIGERGGFALVEPAFLEIELPDLAQGFAKLVERGATSIVVHPYFLSPGRHTRGDVPKQVALIAAQYPQIEYRITEPLAAHPLVVEASIERIRAHEAVNHEARHANTHTGFVHIVGAGPGDPGLLTVKAVEALRAADAVVYDYLVNPDILEYADARAQNIYMGKVGGGVQTSQDEINQLLVKLALEGKQVVRLKGGDPFLFGRGSEEALALRAAGIPFAVVPGVSSALAVPAYAGIPLTHRGLATSVSFVTGAQAVTGELSAELARASQSDTVVVLMGVSHLREIAAQMIASGRSSDTPVAVVRWGTYETQQTVVGTLATIADLAEQQRLRAPSIIVVGPVVSLREQLRWFEDLSYSDAPEYRASLVPAEIAEVQRPQRKYW